MDPNTEAIIRLAWARRLGLADEALLGKKPRVSVVREGAITTVRLFDAAVIAGPRRALDEMATWSHDALAHPRSLLDLARACGGGRLLGSATLSYADHTVDIAGDPLVGDDPELLAAVEQDTPADDRAEAAMPDLDRLFVVLDDDETPVAASGYAIQEGLLAHLTVLTRLTARRRGFGTTAARIATNDTYDEGLVAGWRAGKDNRASRAIAARLGYVEVGDRTAVLLFS